MEGNLKLRLQTLYEEGVRGEIENRLNLTFSLVLLRRSGNTLPPAPPSSLQIKPVGNLNRFSYIKGTARDRINFKVKVCDKLIVKGNVCNKLIITGSEFLKKGSAHF